MVAGKKPYPKATLKKIVKAHSGMNVRKNTDITVCFGGIDWLQGSLAGGAYVDDFFLGRQINQGGCDTCEAVGRTRVDRQERAKGDSRCFGEVQGLNFDSMLSEKE
ncbi:hypothetical protein CCMA1212_008826 [Trichoderma ghanense]|uniref:Uncharacterized protein n=1 Tax=Trichoderma ghanense TaxID=65468 RepID=A0ABY2GTV2_9HYPO